MDRDETGNESMTEWMNEQVTKVCMGENIAEKGHGTGFARLRCVEMVELVLCARARVSCSHVLRNV
jgi:hypothetical protein